MGFVFKTEKKSGIPTFCQPLLFKENLKSNTHLSNSMIVLTNAILLLTVCSFTAYFYLQILAQVNTVCIIKFSIIYEEFI